MLISVIIPTHNRAAYLKEAIGGVLSQTIKGFEIIVVDDGSTDNTKEVVASYKDKVRYIFQKNSERAVARNNGILQAKGDYIAFLDSDDIWLPEHLQACLRAFHNAPKGTGLAFSGSYLMDKKGKIISKIGLSPANGDVLKKIVSRFSSGGCNSSSCLVKKDIFDKAGYFNEDKDLSISGEDWEMWARLAAHTKFVSTNSYTVKIRFHQEASRRQVDRMAFSMAKALDTVYANPEISAKIMEVRRQAYSSLNAVIAINYYASGDMKNARRYLRKSLQHNPLSLFTDKYIFYTLLRSLLGSRFSSKARKFKRSFTRACLNTI